MEAINDEEPSDEEEEGDENDPVTVLATAVRSLLSRSKQQIRPRRPIVAAPNRPNITEIVDASTNAISCYGCGQPNVIRRECNKCSPIQHPKNSQAALNPVTNQGNGQQ